MKYNINIKDPRTQKRVKKAIAFANAFLSDTKPRGWSTRYIDKFFGQQQNELSNYLRGKLLICTNERYSKDSHVCKEYIKNPNGITELLSLLKTPDTYPSVLQVNTNTICVLQLTTDFIKEEFSEELNTLDFHYEEKSSRLWHPLQQVRKQYKQRILSDASLKHQYDIQCCAPTLLHQYSQKIPLVLDKNNKWVQGPMDLWLFGIQSYLKDRSILRNQIAKDAQIPPDIAKVIINALFAGAQLGHNPQSEIYKLLNGDKARIDFLKQYEPLIELRKDIKEMWEYTRLVLPKKTIKIKKTGKEKRLPLSAKQKWILYFDLERVVLNSVRKYLNKNNIRYFLEHDGWSTNKELNTNELSIFVEQETGFVIQLDYQEVSF